MRTSGRRAPRSRRGTSLSQVTETCASRGSLPRAGPLPRLPTHRRRDHRPRPLRSRHHRSRLHRPACWYHSSGLETATIGSGQPRLRQHPSDEPRALSDRGTGVRAPVGDLEGGHGHADTYCDAREGVPLPIRQEGLPRAREVQRKERRVGLQRQVRGSTLKLLAGDSSLREDGHGPAASEDRKRPLQAADVGALLLYRQCTDAAEEASDSGPLEEMGGGEEGETPGAEDRHQYETVEIALMVGDDHEWALARDELGYEDIEPEGTPEERPDGERRGRIRHEPRLLATLPIACAPNPGRRHVQNDLLPFVGLCSMI